MRAPYLQALDVEVSVEHGGTLDLLILDLLILDLLTLDLLILDMLILDLLILDLLIIDLLIIDLLIIDLSEWQKAVDSGVRSGNIHGSLKFKTKYLHVLEHRD